MEAIGMLRDAGWFEGRRVDPTNDLITLGREEFPVTTAAEEFLSEYTGLTISSPTDRSSLVISAERAAGHVFPGWAEAYSKAVGTTMVPVGEYSHLTLYVDLDGGLWGGFDGEFGRGGSSLVEVIQGLFIDKPGWRFDRRIDSA